MIHIRVIQIWKFESQYSVCVCVRVCMCVCVCVCVCWRERERTRTMRYLFNLVCVVFKHCSSLQHTATHTHTHRHANTCALTHTGKRKRPSGRTVPCFGHTGRNTKHTFRSTNSRTQGVFLRFSACRVLEAQDSSKTKVTVFALFSSKYFAADVECRANVCVCVCVCERERVVCLLSLLLAVPPFRVMTG